VTKCSISASKGVPPLVIATVVQMAKNTQRVSDRRTCRLARKSCVLTRNGAMDSPEPPGVDPRLPYLKRNHWL
jgi:hypothetical protein